MDFNYSTDTITPLGGTLNIVGIISSSSNLTGTWAGNVISPTYGGTGINNGSNTLTLSGNLSTTGAFNTTLATGFTGTITLPTATSTLATLALSEALTNKTGYNGLVITANTGVVTTGTWNGTAIAAANGGTGQTVYVIGDLLYASTTTALSKLAAVAAGSYLRSAGIGTAPVWSTVTLPNSVAVGDLLYGSATNVYSNLADIATGNALISGGVTTAPSWGKIGLTTHVSGILAGTNGGTGVNNGSFLLTLSGNLTTTGAFNTTLATGFTGTITLPTATATLATLALSESLTNKTGYNGLVVTANTGVVTTGTWNGTAIAIANGGTGQTGQTAAFNALDPLTTKGDIIVNDGTNSIRLAVGTDGQRLFSDSTTASGVKWNSHASAQSTPTDPATTTSTTGLMMGLAGTITPATTGTVLIIISGDIDNATNNDGAQVQIRTGTGTAPANGAALTGTTRGGLVKMAQNNSAQRHPFSLNCVVTGLTVGTAVWIDVGLAAITGGTARIRDVSVSAVEV